MASLYVHYTEELRDEFGYLATWAPNTHLALGDVGVLRRDAFQRVTSLRQLGVEAAELDAEGRVADYHYMSSGVTRAALNQAAEAGALLAPAAELQARLAFTFEREHAVVFQARACRVHQFADWIALGEAILALDRAGAWDRDHVVITEIISTGPASILISNAAGARIEFLAKSGVLPTTLPLASAAAELAVTSATGIATQIVGAEGLTPLFQVAGLRRRMLGATRFRSSRGDETAQGEVGGGDLLLAEMGYDDVTGPSRTLALD